MSLLGSLKSYNKWSGQKNHFILPHTVLFPHQKQQEHAAKNEEITVCYKSPQWWNSLQLQHQGTPLVLISGRCISYVWGREERAGFHNHEATVHMAHCCNEGVMFLPLIYPDYTMERESLLMEPCVPPLHLSICLFSSSDGRGNCTVSYTLARHAPVHIAALHGDIQGLEWKAKQRN